MAGTLPMPPFSTELLADLHGGSLPPDESERLWPVVRQDPEAMRYLSSLDRVDARLRDLGRDEHIAHPMPAEVAARLERMISDLAVPDDPERLATVTRLPVAPPPVTRSTHPAPANTAPMPILNGSAIFDTGRLDPRELESDLEPVPELEPDADLTEPSRLDERPSRRLRWLTVAAAAAAVVAGAVVAVDALSSHTRTPTAQSTADVQLDASLSPASVLSVMGHHDITGPLATGNALAACLQAAGLDRPILGSRSVVFSGTPGVLVLLAGPKPPQITAAVLGTACAPGNPQVLGRADIG
ncbi:hypothetical protein [Nocardia seriolae]|uniref:Anti-sigma-M factor RsmA n=1 Tax=Nocardia seriolae TaxID=37332 RepID=A0A0B8N8H2_9NOCA|nr:hypothetical protein [Nocardia seriolae]APA94700.1 hypothetical protein NS506_00618 [Nocardia seriolae]MTJ59996.1 hypothetical protein [Nocardia seriolae]MTJ70066.1 hypothetical protein [Nocardia seriolae]MTJ84998.1 hypothetical protein [Nocardia seriolae]MTK28993.1 hypothetical protein [Nocardia seriolae]